MLVYQHLLWEAMLVYQHILLGCYVIYTCTHQDKPSVIDVDVLPQILDKYPNSTHHIFQLSSVLYDSIFVAQFLDLFCTILVRHRPQVWEESTITTAFFMAFKKNKSNEVDIGLSELGFWPLVTRQCNL